MAGKKKHRAEADSGTSTEQVLAIAGALPGVSTNQSGKWTGIKVRGKGFGYLSEDDEVLLLKASKVERAALVGSNPETFANSFESGESGWVQIALPRVDRIEVTELITEAWRMTAAKTVVAEFDRNDIR